MNLPDFITHYHSQTDRPFQNLSDLEPTELSEVIERLKQRRADNPGYKRIFGQRYMDLRRRTETKLRDLFEARGGEPERQSPHYFVLGECAWFSGLYPDPDTVTLDWRSLPQRAVSFTYPDSFVSMRLGPDYGLPPDPLEPYHERVYLMDELADVVARHGLPNGDEDATYEGYHNRKFEKYIEVQVWTDEPVAKYLDGGS
ncbi:MAG: hypothetical protein AAFR51_04010 [Pseudomonadota bacterium]